MTEDMATTNDENTQTIRGKAMGQWHAPETVIVPNLQGSIYELEAR